MMPDVLPLFGSVGRQERAVAAMGVVLSELELASAAPLEVSSGSAPQRFRNRRAKRTQTIRRCEPVQGRLQRCPGQRRRAASHRNIVIRALAWALRPPPRGYARIGLPAASPHRDGALRHCARPPPELSCVRARLVRCTAAPLRRAGASRISAMRSFCARLCALPLRLVRP